MVATNFSELDTLFKEIHRFHNSMAHAPLNELEYDVLMDKLKLYYSSLKNYPNISDKKASIPEIIPVMKTEIIYETKPEIIPKPQPEIIPDPKPEIIPETKPEIIPTKEPEIIPTKEPEIIPIIEPEIIPIIEPEIQEPISPTMPPGTIIQEVKKSSYSHSNLLLDTSSKNNNSSSREIKNIIDINTRIGLIKFFFKGSLEAYHNELSHINHAENYEDAMVKFESLCAKYENPLNSEPAKILAHLIKKVFN